MPRVLSLSLRPKTLSGLFGQEELVASIRQQMATRQPRAFMLYGPSGTGKTTLARIMAVSFQCTHMTEWGNPCKECWDAQSTFNIHEINASEVSGVEELGQVAVQARYKPLSGSKRVFILDEMQRATSAAQNLLLKPFEEPAATTVWIVCTTEPSKILPTLRRRCTTYQLRGLGFTERERFLDKIAKVIKLEKPLDPLVEQVHLSNISSPAMLLQAIEKYAAGASAESAAASIEGSDTNSLRICKAVTSGDWKTLRDLLAVASPDDSRWIRSSVSGWVWGILKKDQSPKSQERAQLSLYDLSVHAPIDDIYMLHWLRAVLYKICKRYRE